MGRGNLAGTVRPFAPPDTHAAVEAFMRDYERLTNLHDTKPWSELIAQDATYWFTTGSFVGKDAVTAAVEHNFAVMDDEVYRFNCVGYQEGEQISGAGRGTNVMVSVTADG